MAINPESPDPPNTPQTPSVAYVSLQGHINLGSTASLLAVLAHLVSCAVNSF